MAFVAEIEIARVARIAALIDVVAMVSRYQHKADICHICALFQAGNVLENVVPVVRLAVVLSFEEFELDRTAPFAGFIVSEPKSDINPASLAAIAAKRFFQFYREGLAFADDLEIGRSRDDATEVQLKRCLAFAPDTPTAYLSEKRRHCEVHDIAKAI
jgi:hypothetical protein